jgi:hypothetical protein
MSNVLDRKVGEFTLLDGFVITASKIATEEVLSKVSFVGNGTYRSGAIKVIGAVVGSMTSKNKYVQYMASGLLIDGAEDILANLKGMVSGPKSNGASNEVIM